MALKKVIATEKLFDPQNPTIILCDQDLEDAIDVKALHVSEIKYVQLESYNSNHLNTSVRAERGHM